MFAIDHKTYSPNFIKQAVELAVKAGLSEDDPEAGKQSSVKDGLSVQTPVGEMTAFISYEDDDYPGIGIDLMPGDHIIGLATCEVDTAHDKELHTIVFADADDDNYSDIIVHYGGKLGDAP